MKLEDLRRELVEDRANARMCPRCGGYGKPLKPLGVALGDLAMASLCEGCDCVFGWNRVYIPLPPPSNEIELGDRITALNDNGQTVTGVVIDIEVVRDLVPFSTGESVTYEDRGLRNERALLQLGEFVSAWVGLRGAFVVEKSATVPFTGI